METVSFETWRAIVGPYLIVGFVMLMMLWRAYEDATQQLHETSAALARAEGELAVLKARAEQCRPRPGWVRPL